MPMDSLMWDNDTFKRRCVGWHLEFTFLPKKCNYTGKYLWLKPAYKGMALITGPGEPVFEYRWCERNAFLFEKIKGTI